MPLKNGTLSEAEEQMMVFQWAAYKPELRWLHDVPNGGSRHPREAANLKRQGVKAGVSDICLPLPKGDYHGLYIEMKVGRNKPTPQQNEFIQFARQNGYSAHVCYGHQEAIQVISQYLTLEKRS